jgi:hypothetical protein
MEDLRVHDHPDGKCTAGKALAVGTVTRVNHARRLGDLVAKTALVAAAGLRKFHRTLPGHKVPIVSCAQIQVDRTTVPATLTVFPKRDSIQRLIWLSVMVPILRSSIHRTESDKQAACIRPNLGNAARSQAI